MCSESTESTLVRPRAWSTFTAHFQEHPGTLGALYRVLRTLAALFRAMVVQFRREHSPMHSESRWEHSSLRWC